jgi:hypothetical protein
MSQTKVQLVSNIVGNVSDGASFTGIVTASAFSGDGSLLTGGGGDGTDTNTGSGLTGVNRGANGGSGIVIIAYPTP